MGTREPSFRNFTNHFRDASAYPRRRHSQRTVNIFYDAFFFTLSMTEMQFICISPC